MKGRFLFFMVAILAAVAFAGCTSKKGCMDPGSISFDPAAKIDDGSCMYPAYALTPVFFKKLDNVFSETSGLTYKDKRVWTIVDESGENKMYSIDLLNGNIKEKLELTGVSGVDFEAVTSSDTHFFIGDIGNNEGNRTDLAIYKIPAPQTYSPFVTVNYEKIGFRYPEQTDFRGNSNSNFDAEALMYFKDHLFLLTKNHENNQTSLYEIPAYAGNHKAQLRGIFDAKGLITDAAFSPSGNKLAMLGYNRENGKAFIWMLTGFSEDKFFLARKTLVEIGTMNTIGQVEGIAFHNENNVFISNEQYGGINANLYYLDISSIQ